MAPLLETSPALDAPAAASPVDHSRRIEELGRIILAYSDVTEKLQQSHDQLLRTVQTLQLELGEKNRLLERKNRLAALGEMAAGLAHEIRNPLGGIQLYASLLAGDVKDRPDSLKVVHKITAGVKRLEGLVGQVLQFSREMTATLDDADLAELVAQSVDLASRTLEERGVRCVVDGPSTLPVRADGLLLSQAVLNLVLNAAEAMEPGGVVTVQYGGAGGVRFALSVRDTGPGIPPELIDKVFNPFFTTKDTGTGLGLAIVHRIVEAHNGTITAANNPDGGARFEVTV